MSTGWILAGILVPTVLAGLGVLTLTLAGQCDHTMYPTYHQETGRTFWSCRCGERFQP